MHVSAETLDDLLRAVYGRLLRTPHRVEWSKPHNREVSGVLLEVKKPTARLSRTETKGTIFSCLGETLWYLSGTDECDSIAWYVPLYRQFSDDKRTLHGAYGPRLRRMRGKIDQLKSVIKLLKRKPQTRQAVIELFNAEDILKNYKDIPCTCTIQFMIRGGRLHVLTNIEIKRCLLGLPHDVFAFTFLQELVARSVGVQLGTYKHAVGSLHLYDKHRTLARNFLKEGWQSTIAMPHMPARDPWQNLKRLLTAEKENRTRGKPVRKSKALPKYWGDLIRLLEILAATGRKSPINALKREMATNIYDA